MVRLITLNTKRWLENTQKYLGGGMMPDKVRGEIMSRIGGESWLSSVIGGQWHEREKTLFELQ